MRAHQRSQQNIGSWKVATYSDQPRKMDAVFAAEKARIKTKCCKTLTRLSIRRCQLCLEAGSWEGDIHRKEWVSFPGSFSNPCRRQAVCGREGTPAHRSDERIMCKSVS